jgi:hypothetical protein
VIAIENAPRLRRGGRLKRTSHSQRLFNIEVQIEASGSVLVAIADAGTGFNPASPTVFLTLCSRVLVTIAAAQISQERSTAQSRSREISIRCNRAGAQTNRKIDVPQQRLFDSSQKLSSHP